MSVSEPLRTPLKHVAGEGRRLAFEVLLLKEVADLGRLCGTAEGARDQLPLFVWCKHAARLQACHECGMLGEDVAPQGPQASLLLDCPDLDPKARGARRNIDRWLEVRGLHGLPRACRAGWRWRG